ncbi:MAG: BCCT family transporter [Pseudomonadota bacterium]
MRSPTDDAPLPEDLAPDQTCYDTDHETGENNIQVFGLDIHNPVFPISATLILVFVISALAFPERASHWLLAARNGVLSRADWLFILVTNVAVLFTAALAFTGFGKIRLGGDDAKPEFSTRSWLAMLFSAGVGIGMLFYGAAEPLAYYTGWSGTPLGTEPLTADAQRLAFSATIFHWGLTPWAVYAVIGLSLAFFTFNKGLPLTVRSIFYPLLGDRVWGWPGHIIDLAAVIATLFGLATSLGLGAKQAASGLGFLFGIGDGLQTQVLLIVGITAMAIFSVVRGLEGGVKVLSNVNIALALVLLVFLIAAGPTASILSSYLPNAGAYIADSFRLSNWVGRQDQEWFHGWTIFYWAWWVSWSPFVGMFIARVSRGRTIREFLFAVLVIPTLVAIVWFSSFGTAAIEQVQGDIGSLPDGITDVSLVLFHTLENLPFPRVSAFFAIVLLIIFFVTSSDSGSLVIDSITAGGKLDAPVPQRVFWAMMEGLVAIVLLVGGGSAALSALQAGTIAAGLPFAFVVLLACVSLVMGLKDEKHILDDADAERH